MTDQGEYYRRRMEEELAAAEGSNDVAIAEIHRALADGYRRLIEEQFTPAKPGLRAAL